jgi:hypothetical protein
MGWTAGVRFMSGARNVSLLHSVQTGFGTDPASYPMGTGALCPGLNWPESEAVHSLPSRAEVKSGAAILQFPRRFHGLMLN